MTVEFTAHNIRLDDGTFTKSEQTHSMVENPWFITARRVLEAVFPGDKSQLRLADLGCLEGGYAVEFARMGFEVLGVEIRQSNIAACNYVKSKTDLPNLEFVRDDAFNIARYGVFDAVFCCGLLNHLDRPKHHLETLSSVTTKLLILQTHFSLADSDGMKFKLSAPSENEGLAGRWYTEFSEGESFSKVEAAKWASWDNLPIFLDPTRVSTADNSGCWVRSCHGRVFWLGTKHCAVPTRRFLSNGTSRDIHRDQEPEIHNRCQLTDGLL